MTRTAFEDLTTRVVAAYEDRSPASKALYERARRVLPGGVSGNLRHFAPYPLYMRGGRGAVTTDVDGNDLLDCFLCNGPLLLGHRPAEVEAAVAAARETGPLVVNPALLADCAERVVDIVPCAERVRFLNSGTEAVLTAVRYARGFTGRSRIVKFFGHYHGQDDQFLVGASPRREPFGAGVPRESYGQTLTLPFNDIEAVQTLLAQDDDIAAVLLDPAMHSGGLWGTTKAYLEALRAVAREKGVVLIFDEVITGFRLAPGGAQQLYGVTPDLVTLAKAMGAGERLAAVAGRADVMSVVDPLGSDRARRVFQSGTGNDSTAGLAAGTAALDRYRAHGARGDYEALDALGRRLAEGLRAAFAAAGLPAHVNQQGSMLQLFFTSGAPQFVAYSALDQGLVDLFYLALIGRGVLLSLPTSNHIYLSFEHGPAEIDRILAAARDVLRDFPFADAFAATAPMERV